MWLVSFCVRHFSESSPAPVCFALWRPDIRGKWEFVSTFRRAAASEGSINYSKYWLPGARVTDLYSRVRDIDAAINSDFPERVPAFSWGQVAEAAVGDPRPREWEAGEAGTGGGQPPHPGVWHEEAASEVNMGQGPRQPLEARVTNTPQMTEIQLGQELVTHQDLTHMTIDHHFIIIIFTLIIILTMISCQLIETHWSRRSEL